MSAPPGWYPDPGGSADFRYWDGRGWSAQTSPQPSAAPPTTPLGGPTNPTTAGTPSSGSRRPWLWLAGGVAVLVTIVLIGVFAVRQVVGGGTGGVGADPPASANVCPPGATESESAPPQRNDGRVHGGRLSFPRLGAPWEAPKPETRVPFGRDVYGQFVTVETGDFLGFQKWGAEILVGELVAGDGFYEPRDGVAIVIRCITGTFYGDTQVTRDDRRSEAITVDGHEAWLAETNLGFDVPNLKAKHELLTVVVVDDGDGTAGVFVSTVPENSPQHLPTARQALQQLRVDD